MVLQAYSRVNKIAVSEKTNRLLYWMSNAPILRKYFHCDLVQEYVSKEGIALLVQSLSLLKKLTYKFIYTAIIVLIVSANTPVTFNVVFVSLTVMGAIMHDIIFMDADDYNNVILLRMNPHEYAMLRINGYLIREGILFFLAFFMLSFALQLPIYVLVYSLLVYLAIHVCGQAVTIRKAMKNGYVEPKGNNKTFMINGLIFVACILFIWLILTIDVELNVHWLMLIELPFIIAGIYSYRWLSTVPDWHKYFRYNLSIERINEIENLANTSEAKATLDTLNKNITMEKADSSKHGYSFIFDTFLKRYGNIFNRRNIWTLVAIAVVTLGVAVVPLVIKFDRTQVSAFIFAHLHYLFLLVYFFSSNSKSFVVACFLQIDRYLVNYHFFRRSQDIITNFKLRLFRVIKITILPSALLAVCLVFLYLFHGGNTVKISEAVIIGLLPLVLALFYSVYYLSAYYLFQPFSFDGTIVNKTYSIVTSGIYAVAYILSDLDEVKFSIMALAIIIAVLAVLSVGLFIAVFKLAPKEFRVR